jgi:hypothetical protein
MAFGRVLDVQTPGVKIECAAEMGSSSMSGTVFRAVPDYLLSAYYSM